MTRPIPAGDVRDKYIGLRGTPDDLAAVGARAAAAGVSGNVWARDTLLDALEAEAGYRDTVRRAAGRRPNRRPRRDRQGDPPGLMLRVSEAEHQAITELASGKGTTITGWAWGVLERAMNGGQDSSEKEGQQR